MKRPNQDGAKEARSRGLAVHLRGWQPGLLAVFIAGTSALVAVPRPVDAIDLPEPKVDLPALDRIERESAALAAEAQRSPLDVDVRALGDAYLAYGRADASGDESALVIARDAIVKAARTAIAQGPRQVLSLRAVELARFLVEVRRWEATGIETAELRALGGGFTRMIARSGWIEGKTLLLDRRVLAALFKKRWSEITTLREGPFAIDVAEARALYRFFLRHPVPDAAARALGGRAGEAPTEQYRLRKLDELTKIDPAYPHELARGVLLYKSGRYPQAVEAFRRHLDAHPDGPYTLRAQNYLRAALGKSLDE